MHWFLYDNGLRHERVKHSSPTIAENNVETTTLYIICLKKTKLPNFLLKAFFNKFYLVHSDTVCLIQCF